MGFLFQDKTIDTDAEGYLLNNADWSEDLMFFMAKADGLELNDEHLEIIKTVREYFQEYATTPPIRSLIKMLKNKGLDNLASSVKLAVLFPQGAAKSAAKYAGLPKPVKCI
ncbi:MAG: TusE/DsrC/DsvC family sulfur relay protein [Succinivibrio sp.]